MRHAALDLAKCLCGKSPLSVEMGSKMNRNGHFLSAFGEATLQSCRNYRHTSSSYLRK